MVSLSRHLERTGTGTHHPNNAPPKQFGTCGGTMADENTVTTYPGSLSEVLDDVDEPPKRSSRRERINTQSSSMSNESLPDNSTHSHSSYTSSPATFKRTATLPTGTTTTSTSTATTMALKKTNTIPRAPTSPFHTRANRLKRAERVGKVTEVGTTTTSRDSALFTIHNIHTAGFGTRSLLHEDDNGDDFAMVLPTEFLRMESGKWDDALAMAEVSNVHEKEMANVRLSITSKQLTKLMPSMEWGLDDSFASPTATPNQRNVSRFSLIDFFKDLPLRQVFQGSAAFLGGFLADRLETFGKNIDFLQSQAQSVTGKIASWLFPSSSRNKQKQPQSTTTC